jgi:hypothetical protein
MLIQNNRQYGKGMIVIMSTKTRRKLQRVGSQKLKLDIGRHVTYSWTGSQCGHASLKEEL